MRLSACPAVFFLFIPAATCATTYVVNPDGTGDFPTIQEAIDATVDGDIVELADGTFTGPGNRSLSTGARRITIRSAAGDAELCTIDCEGAGSGIRRLLSGSNVEHVTIRNASGVGIWIVNEGASLLGVRVLGCQRGLIVGTRWVHTIRTSVRATDCVISGNGPPGWLDFGPVGWGGGAYILDDATFENCIISGNVAELGGGVYFRGGSGQNHAAVTFTNCTITGNLALGGGGIHGGMPQHRFHAVMNLDRTILHGNFGGDLNLHALTDVTTIECSLIDLTRVSGAIDAITYGSGNVYGDPQFCDPIAWEDVPTTGGDLTLNATSPAANSPLCTLIGALGVGCGGTSVGDLPSASLAFALRPATPNPFRGVTEIGWEVPRRVSLTIAIYDVAGRRVRTLLDGTVGPGAGVEPWHGRSDAGGRVAAGVYFVRMTTPGFEETRKIVTLP